MGNRGVGSWMWKCSNCGLVHRITNLGRRRAINADGMVIRTTVHEANCNGWTLLGSMDPRWFHLYEKVSP